MHATNTIRDNVNSTTSVVFVTDGFSVLQALTNDKLPLLEQVLFNIRNHTIVLQWIPSHCGVYGNEQADILAKQGAGQQKEENPVCLAEMKTIIKSLYRKPKLQDSYRHLSKPEQTVIFRLRTGHNRLNKHLNRVMKVVSSPMCPCDEAEQDTTHILQLQEPSGIETEDMANTNNHPGKAIWNSGRLTEDHQIRRGSRYPSVKANYKKRRRGLLQLALWNGFCLSLKIV